MLSNAHNYSANSLPIYYFLCDLQKQGIRSYMGFNWGNLLQRKSFLPRVVYKDFILSEARWTVKKEDVNPFTSLNGTSLLEAISTWRTDNHIPQKVKLVEGDNTLLIDLENEISIAMWLDTIKKQTQFVLEEFLFTESGVVQRNQEGFTNQMILCFYNDQKLKTEVQKTIS